MRHHPQGQATQTSGVRAHRTSAASCLAMLQKQLCGLVVQEKGITIHIIELAFSGCHLHEPLCVLLTRLPIVPVEELYECGDFCTHIPATHKEYLVTLA